MSAHGMVFHGERRREVLDVKNVRGFRVFRFRVLAPRAGVADEHEVVDTLPNAARSEEPGMPCTFVSQWRFPSDCAARQALFP
jgi:hypothetical protein